MAKQDPENVALGMRPKLSERVADQLRALIQKGDFAPGSQLPTSTELVDQFGVSRTVIREALSSLRVDGLVKAHQGRGVFVCEDISQQPFRLCSNDLSEREHMSQAMELRLSMEVSSAEIAATRRTDADIKAIETALKKHHSAHVSGALGQTEDFAFHLAIANATKNSYMVDFLRFLGPYIIPNNAMRDMTEAELSKYHESLRDEHLEITKAIKAGDAATAGTAMRDHLYRGLQLNISSLDNGADKGA